MKIKYMVLVLLGILLSANIGNGQEAEIPSEQDRHFTLKVLPLLKAKCMACHGNDKDDLLGKYDLTSRASALAGGESGDPAIAVGSPDTSPFFKAINWDGLEMPPKENDRLNEKQIEIVRKWIADGAHWPNEKQQDEIKKEQWAQPINEDGILMETIGGQSDDWTYRRYKPEDVWAFKHVTKPAVPDSTGHPIDAFVKRKLASVSIDMVQRADATALIRRATYDLTGLPPTPDEIEKFKIASGKNHPRAWNELIERLLATPRYGERWGQHWLDVVRYADTAGISNDFERSNAWRYRDYVIRAFNDDKPYNRFIVEQIAGDDLVREQENNADGNNDDGYMMEPSEAIVATSFLRMGPWEHTAMTPEAISRQNFLDDIVNGVGQTFLSTPLRCCKCHDHKFDPIPTRDYYRFYAAFSTTQPAEIPTPFLNNENRAAFEEERKHVEALLATAMEDQNRLYKKRESAAKSWYVEQGFSFDYVPFEERKRIGNKKDKPPRFVGLTTEEQGILKVREQDVMLWTRRLERFEPLAQSVYYGGSLNTFSNKLRLPNPNNKNHIAKSKILSASFIYEGGSPFSKSGKVTPGVLSGLQVSTHTKTESDPYALPTGMKQRRVALARWIARRDNPLTKRSIVNRIWQYHFGKGLAGNPNNIGATGKKPTHPELLDWLAEDFVENEWKIKRMHRLIMTSAAYQTDTEHPNADQLDDQDPNRELLAVFQPRRLTAEEIRDSMLAISGELELEVGGLPVRPEMNLEVAFAPRMIQFSLAPAYQPSRTPKMRNRRSVYAYRIRGLPDPMMKVFNKPNSDESCEIRDTASVSPQVFALMNSDVATKRSIAMALRLEREAKTVDERIRLGYVLTNHSEPNNNMLQKLKAHYEEMVVYHIENKPEPVEYPTKIPRSVVEEFSGEVCNYSERLDIYEDYVADKHAWDVSGETRALADVCLLLFNSNAFVYVY